MGSDEEKRGDARSERADAAGAQEVRQAADGIGADAMEGFLSRFRPSQKLIQQLENDVRGVSRDRLPNIVLGSSPHASRAAATDVVRQVADESLPVERPDISRPR